MSIYTTAEVAKLLKVNVTKVLGWINTCELEAFNVGSGKKQPRYRITQESLEKFQKSRTKAKPPSKPRRRKPYKGRIFIT